MSATKRPRRATRAQVRQFLAAAGYAGTPPDELVDAYVDLVGAAGRPGLPRHRLAVHLTAQSPGWVAPAMDVFEGGVARAAAGARRGRRYRAGRSRS